MKQETVSTHSNLKTTKQLQIYFRTYFTLLLLSKHWINSAVCSFLQLLGCWSYEEKINCEYVLFRRQNMVCSSSPIYCNHAPAYQLSVVFSPQHPTPPPSPLYYARERILPWKLFRGKISISGWISYAIILMCY